MTRGSENITTETKIKLNYRINLKKKDETSIRRSDPCVVDVKSNLIVQNFIFHAYKDTCISTFADLEVNILSDKDDF